MSVPHNFYPGNNRGYFQFKFPLVQMRYDDPGNYVTYTYS